MANIKGAQGVPRAVIYTRVSTSQQGEGTSLAGQYAACAKRAQDEGALIVGAFEEVKSGAMYASRVELQKALAMIEKGEAQMLILSKLDRTGRDVEDLRDVRRRVEAAGGKLVFADGMTFEKGAIGNLLFTQLGAFAEFEKELIRERMVAGIERLAASGKQPGRTAPYGYRVWKKTDAIRGECTSEEVGTYAIVEDEARWIKPMFERFAAFESVRSVAAWLEREGAPTRTGKKWQTGTLQGYLKNEVYIGRPAWRKTRYMTDESRAEIGLGISWEEPRPRDEWVVLSAPPLVDEELFYQARKAVSEGRRDRSGRTDGRYLLTGLVACPVCGKRCHARCSTKTHIYKCAGGSPGHIEIERTCDTPSVIGPRLERLVVEALSEFLCSPTILENAVAEFQASQKSKSSQSNDETRLKHLEREIEACHKREEIAASKEIEAVMNGQNGSAFASLRLQSEGKRAEAERERGTILERRAIGKLEVAPIETDAATRLIETLEDDSISDAQKGLLLRPFIVCVYPRFVPPELRVSAKVWRSNGCPENIESDGGHPYSRHLGGCDIILRLGSENAVIILSRHLMKWVPTNGRGHRRSLMGVWETFLHIEEKCPFPMTWTRTSTVDSRAHKRRN